VRAFNDYCRGAFETLAWLEGLMEDLKQHPKGWRILTDEVNAAIVDIKRGVGVDFRHRLRATA